MGSEWEEIQRLAADFQKIQLTSTQQLLSEGNCIEIVSLLSEKQMINVIFTTDGKEYVLADHLESEINDELYAHDGRVNLVELSKVLNVDLAHIEPIAAKIAEEDSSVRLMLGQLINDDYITELAVEINEKLTLNGQLSVADLTVVYDLPTDFLQHTVVEKNLGKIIRGKQDTSDPKIIYTQSYVNRCKAKITGGLAALTFPISLSTFLQEVKVPEQMFYSLFDEIKPAGTIVSKGANAQYIPNLYAKCQSDWVNSFYSQNGFLEYDSLSKLGISDPKQYIKKQLPNVNFCFLKRTAVGPKITELTVMTAITDCNASKSYLDLSTILPSVMSVEDIEELYTTLLSRSEQNNFTLLGSVVFSKDYLNEIVSPCRDVAIAKAKASVENGTYSQYVAEKILSTTKNASSVDNDLVEKQTDKREERRKKASHGKGGGGTQGRETKTKSTKKHGRSGDKGARDSDDENMSTKTNKLQPLELISLEDIETTIHDKLESEGLEDLSSDIASLFQPNLNQLALTTAKTLFETSQTTQQRQTLSTLQEKLNIIFVDIRLYEKGLKVFDSDIQQQLIKYLLKTLGNDVCNEIFWYVGNECNLNVKSKNMNPDQRNKICLECDADYKLSLIELNKALMGSSVDEFLVAAENATKTCGMVIRKIDKKKDKSLIIEHKEKLNQELSEATDPAVILHLTLLKIFTAVTNTILHASGRYVSNIMRYLQPSLTTEQSQLLTKFHDLVLKTLNTASNKSELSEDEKSQAQAEIESTQKQIIDLALTFHKQSA